MIMTSNLSIKLYWLSLVAQSLLLHILGLILFGLFSHIIAKKNPATVEKKPSITLLEATSFESEIEKVIVQKQQNPITPTTPAPTPSNPKRRFNQTNSSQESLSIPDQARFIGEYNTQERSDDLPDKTATLQASIRGVNPRNADDMQSFQSSYKEGDLSTDTLATNSPDLQAKILPDPLDPPTSQAIIPATPTSQAPPIHSTSQVSDPTSLKPQQEVKPTESTTQEHSTAQKPHSAHTSNPSASVTPPPPPKTQAKPSTSESAPLFKSEQRKTKIIGSISRTGVSSLSTIATPMGKYQAQISKIIEQEWQKNCFRHRDYIVPGFLTARFYVQPNGSIRSVQFIGSMKTGEIQKGFTLNAIRNSKLPAMPSAVKQETKGEELELIFNFYF